MIATMPVQEVKRRGMSVLDAQLKSGPVLVVANNTPKYVVLFASEVIALLNSKGDTILGKL